MAAYNFKYNAYEERNKLTSGRTKEGKKQREREQKWKKERRKETQRKGKESRSEHESELLKLIQTLSRCWCGILLVTKCQHALHPTNDYL